MAAPSARGCLVVQVRAWVPLEALAACFPDFITSLSNHYATIGLLKLEKLQEVGIGL